MLYYHSHHYLAMVCCITIADLSLIVPYRVIATHQCLIPTCPAIMLPLLDSLIPWERLLGPLQETLLCLT